MAEVSIDRRRIAAARELTTADFWLFRSYGTAILLLTLPVCSHMRHTPLKNVKPPLKTVLPSNLLEEWLESVILYYTAVSTSILIAMNKTEQY